MQVTDCLQSPRRASSLRTLSILLEMTGQTIPVAMKILLLIKTIQSDMSNYVIVCHSMHEGGDFSAKTLRKRLLKKVNPHI